MNFRTHTAPHFHTHLSPSPPSYSTLSLYSPHINTHTLKDCSQVSNMRNVGLGHTRQTNTLHGRAPLIINRSQYMCRCLEVVVDMPRLGIGPSSLTGHQAAAKVLLQIVLKAQEHASVSRSIASTKHVHMHTRTTSSRQAKTITAVALSLPKRMDTNHGWGSDPAQEGHQAVVECIDLSISI